MIYIISKRENFRRCGISHPKAATEYPDDKFSKKEITILKADPMLTVKYTEDPVIAETPALKDMTVAELHGLMDKLVLPHDNRATKAVLIRMIETNTAESPAKE